MKEKLSKIAPFGYLAVAVLLLLNVVSYLFTLFSSDKYISLRKRPEMFLSQIAIVLFAVLFGVIYKGLTGRKRWAYWANLIVFILILVTLPFGGVDLTGIIILVTGVLIGLDKPRYVN